MRKFFNRFLPADERHSALWLGLGGSAVTWAVAEFGFQVMDRLPIYDQDSTMSMGVAFAIQALAQFALVTLLVAVLIRAARAPKVLALFIALGALVGGSMEFVNLVDGSFYEVVGAASVSLGTVFGALIGAWLASTVTLARMTDSGFSGDDSEEGDGLKRKPAFRGWGFMGLEGRPLEGAALLAVAFVLVTVIPALVTAALNVGVSFIPMEEEPGLVDDLLTYGGPLVVFAAWFFSAKLISRRTGVVTLWMSALGSVLYYVVTGLWFAVPFLGESLIDGSLEIASSLSALGVPAAALLGTAVALRVKPATLSAPDQQDPGA